MFVKYIVALLPLMAFAAPTVDSSVTTVSDYKVAGIVVIKPAGYSDSEFVTKFVGECLAKDTKSVYSVQKSITFEDRYTLACAGAIEVDKVYQYNGKTYAKEVCTEIGAIIVKSVTVTYN
ncbi:hypothetical protein TREMEDRAFT_59218 [Tremella mesenterica DSM 1558]|uniref:uncharacterized protein n=1 Tax=Tremella mesenterica (strain ATCC 24925 / CBS 8224 / DSM 1558 / NBRC 9311 / NRRL Y-6157 / RJB 2259-6 / UBC 559-6) TaxID=578456 RepID=UPI0003F49A39|nr:uncharacterized protein TREMEDRAFT_59218 [Tremella mesenterica DSM 1558]EIW73055.1 hypothetical protein TREMEDRAFT_59218 [Tremella mesenterica DSM 1558]